MSEPYEGGECPVCGSTNTGTYSAATAARQGFGARCYDCLTIWQFPGNAGEEDAFFQSLADMAFSGVKAW